MQCDETRALLFEYHDRSLAEPAHRAVEGHLNSCDLCRHQLADIRAMANAAAGWQDETPPPWQPAAAGAAPLPMRPRNSQWLRDWLPLAACLALTVFVVSGMEVGTADNGIYVRFGGDGNSADDNTVSSAELQAALEQLRSEQALEQQLLSETLLTANRDQRRRELEAVLTLVSTQLDVQADETVDSLRFLIDRQQQDQRRLSELDQRLQTISYRLPEGERL